MGRESGTSVCLSLQPHAKHVSWVSPFNPILQREKPKFREAQSLARATKYACDRIAVPGSLLFLLYHSPSGC